MQKAAAIWVFKTQEVSKLPQSTTAKIMEGIGSLYESALVNIHAHVTSVLNESGISPDTIPNLSGIFSPDGVHGSLCKAAAVLQVSFAICSKYPSYNIM